MTWIVIALVGAPSLTLFPRSPGAAMPWIVLALFVIAVWIWIRLFRCRAKVKKYWNQLLVWRDWKKQMETWMKAYEKYFADNCTCNAPDPPPPPDAPTWPNGEEPL
jgi:hypothetical protein